jgi:hypothetical protein
MSSEGADSSIAEVPKGRSPYASCEPGRRWRDVPRGGGHAEGQTRDRACASRTNPGPRDGREEAAKDREALNLVGRERIRELRHRDDEHEVEEELEPGSAPALAFVERTDAWRREVAGARSRHRTVSALDASRDLGACPIASPRQLAAASSSSPSRIAAVAPTAR